MNTKLKLMLLGYGRHGKDTVAEILARDYEYEFASSSWAAAEHAVYPTLALRYDYNSVEECFNDRANHRQEWYELIKAYNTPDLSRLAQQIYSTTDVYVGIRDRDEFYAVKNEGLFDYAIWVDASNRLPVESTDSCTVTKEDADIVLDNNGPEEYLPAKVQNVLNSLYQSGIDKLKYRV
jgi:hypothetical protein